MSVNPKWRIKDWFSDLDERALERLRIYQIELVRWTKTVNLISSNTIDEADRIHFSDSILGAKIVLQDAPDINELWDIGSGNGFPGVVFSILRPTLAVICLDSDDRKVSFLKQLGLRLELENLGVRSQRIEAIPSNSISFACARGFASLDRGLTLSDKQFNSGASFYHFKGPDFDSELVALKKVPSLKWSSSIVGSYNLPALEVLVDGKIVEKRDSRVIVKTVKSP